MLASLPFLIVPEINNAPVPSFLTYKFLALSITPEIVAEVPLLSIFVREPVLVILPPTLKAPAWLSISKIPPLVITELSVIFKPFVPLVFVIFKLLALLIVPLTVKPEPAFVKVAFLSLVILPDTDIAPVPLFVIVKSLPLSITAETFRSVPLFVIIAS